MAISYHLDPETNLPNRCKAKIECRFGESTQHFPNIAKAREAASQPSNEQEATDTPLDTPKPSESHSEPPKPKQDTQELKRLYDARLRYAETQSKPSTQRMIFEFMAQENSVEDMRTILEMNDDVLLEFLSA